MSGSARYSALSRPAPGDPTRPVLEMTFRGHRRDICCAAFQPSPIPSSWGMDEDSRKGSGTHPSAGVPPRLLTAGADGAVMLWDARPTNRALRFVGHRGPVLGCDYCPASVAGSSVTLLASCGLDGYARLWVPNLKRTSTTYPSSYYTRQQGEGGGGASANGNGTSWRVHTGAARAIKFAQDGSNLIYTAGDDKSVKAWDLNYTANGSHYPTGEPLVTFRGSRFLGNFNASGVPTRRSGSGATGATAPPKASSATSSHTNWIRCLAVQKPSAGGSFSHYVASGGDDNVVMVWDTRSPHAGPVHSFYEHKASIRGLSFHENGHHLAAGDANGVINLFDMRRASSAASPAAAGHSRPRYGLLQHYADAHGAGGVAVNEVCFAPSSATSGSSWLLSAGDDGTAKLWDTVEGFLYCTVQAHNGPVRTVNFTDDGNYFVTAGADGVAMVWHCGLTARKADATPAASAGPQLQAPTRPTKAIQSYTYYDDEAETSAPQHLDPTPRRQTPPPPPSLPAPVPRPTARALDAPTGAVDPSYLEWQRRHNLHADSGKAENGSRDRHGRPPLPPGPRTADAPPTAADPLNRFSEYAALSEDRIAKEEGDSPAAKASAGDVTALRERSFERSEERYSHISSPQKEREVKAEQQQKQEQQPQRRAVKHHAQPSMPAPATAGSVTDELEEQADVVRRERLAALAERRLENVENAVASLVEFVQEENAHRDRALAAMQEEVDRRHARQREEMLTLKTMMEQLLAQQSMLINRLAVVDGDRRTGHRDDAPSTSASAAVASAEDQAAPSPPQPATKEEHGVDPL